MSDIILNEENRTKLKGAVEEMVNSKYRIRAEQDLQKDITARVKTEVEMMPKMFRKLSKTAYDDSAKRQNDELTEILDLAEELGFYQHHPE